VNNKLRNTQRHKIYLLFNFWSAVDFVRMQEVSGNSNESIFWPPSKPVHGTTRDKGWEFERSVPEFLT